MDNQTRREYFRQINPHLDLMLQSQERAARRDWEMIKQKQAEMIRKYEQRQAEKKEQEKVKETT